MLIHPVESCRQCPLCLESLSWSPEQDYAHRLASIQFEGYDPVDADGDVVLSNVAKYCPTKDPDVMDIPRDAALIYTLRPCLKDSPEVVSEQKTSRGSGASFNFVRADRKTPNARVLLIGSVSATGSHAGPSAAEAGEGRKMVPSVFEVSNGESEGEGVPKRGVSAPPPSDNLNRGGIASKTDIGWSRSEKRRQDHVPQIRSP